MFLLPLNGGGFILPAGDNECTSKSLKVNPMKNLTTFSILLTTLFLNTPSLANDVWKGYSTITKEFMACKKDSPLKFSSKWHKSQGCRIYDVKYDSGKRQYIQWDLNNGKSDGSFSHTVTINNKEYLDGDTMCFGVNMLTKKNKPVWSFKVSWGVNVRSKKSKTWKVKLPKEAYDAIKKVRMGFSHCDQRDDKKLWSKIIATSTAICAGLTSGVGASYCAKAGVVAEAVNKNN